MPSIYMNRFLTPFVFVAICALSHAYADEQPVKGAVDSFLAAMRRGDVDIAFSLVYQPVGAEQRTQARVRSLVEKAKRAGKSPEYIDSSAQGTIAIAVVKDTARKPDGKADFDAILLLNREGRWLVVMGIAEIEDRRNVLTGEERQQLAQLRQWQDVRMRELTSASSQPK